MCGLIDAPFNDLVQYSEVLQDSTFDLLDAGKLKFASGCSITLSSALASGSSRTWGNTPSAWSWRPHESPTTRGHPA
jgi:succinyl-CoA:acetate CoA-transferase